MREKIIKLYQFDELSESAKETAVEKLADINVYYGWWDFVYDDAENVKLKLTEFDLDRGYCRGEFIEGADDTAHLIIKNHGKDCETFQTATNYLKERTELVKKYSDGKQIDIVAEDNEYDFDVECDELDNDFLYSILEDYRIILSKEYNYLTSEEVIVETIKANEYEFDESGELV